MMCMYEKKKEKFCKQKHDIKWSIWSVSEKELLTWLKAL